MPDIKIRLVSAAISEATSDLPSPLPAWPGAAGWFLLLSNSDGAELLLVAIKQIVLALAHELGSCEKNKIEHRCLIIKNLQL